MPCDSTGRNLAALTELDLDGGFHRLRLTRQGIESAQEAQRRSHAALNRIPASQF